MAATLATSFSSSQPESYPPQSAADAHILKQGGRPEHETDSNFSKLILKSLEGPTRSRKMVASTISAANSMGNLSPNMIQILFERAINETPDFRMSMLEQLFKCTESINTSLSTAIANKQYGFISKLAQAYTKFLEISGALHSHLEQFPIEKIYPAIEFAMYNEILPNPALIDLLMSISSTKALDCQKKIQKYLAGKSTAKEVGLALCWAVYAENGQTDIDVKELACYLRKAKQAQNGLPFLDHELVLLLLKQSHRHKNMPRFADIFLPEEIQSAFMEAVEEKNVELAIKLLDEFYIHEEDLQYALTTIHSFKGADGLRVRIDTEIQKRAELQKSFFND
jgi:hypothetical protein